MTWYQSGLLPGMAALAGFSHNDSHFSLPTISDSCCVCICSIVGSTIVGLTGVLPLILLQFSKDDALIKKGCQSSTLRLLLSFAVGGLLGDVFLHLLPEAWSRVVRLSGSELHQQRVHLTTLGLWILLGIFTFVVVEIIFIKTKDDSSDSKIDDSVADEVIAIKRSSQLSTVNDKSDKTAISNGNGFLKSAPLHNRNIKQVSNGHLNGGTRNHVSEASTKTSAKCQIEVAGYLNLLANGIDNFTHGLAVAASFLIGIKVGLLTTAAIIIHEIPHEIGDFAILIKSGFSKWEAVKAQMATASIGIMGAIFTLSASSIDTVDQKTSWILPFTCGGFLNIALVTILPDLLREDNTWESVKQVIFITAGIAVMGLVSSIL